MITHTKMHPAIGVVIVITLMLVQDVNAIDYSKYRAEAGTLVGSFFTVDTLYDSNIFNATKNKTSDALYVGRALLVLGSSVGLNSHILSVGMESGVYEKSDKVNYENFYIDLENVIEVNAVARFNSHLSRSWMYEVPGTGFSEGVTQEGYDAIEFGETRLALVSTFGISRTQLSVDVNTELYIRGYEHSNVLLFDPSYRNHTGGLVIYYTTLSRTRLSLAYSDSAVDYKEVDENGMIKDSDDQSIKLGLDWEASPLLLVSAYTGIHKKVFRQNSDIKFKGVDWQLGVKWKPLSYSIVDVTSSRSLKEAGLDGNFIDEIEVTLGWSHEWNYEINTLLNIEYTTKNYSGINRNDIISSSKMSIRKVLFERLELSLYLNNIYQNSNVSQYDISKYVIGISARIGVFV